MVHLEHPWTGQRRNGSQPGGTEALFAFKGHGLAFTSNYQAATTAVLHSRQGFPFNNVINILSNPFNSNQVWVDTFGNGMWNFDLTQLGIPAVPQDVTVQTMDSGSALVSWMTQAVPASFTIQASTDGVNFTHAISETVPDWQDSSYLFTGLSSNTEYYFRMEAVNSTSDSAWSMSPRRMRRPGLIALRSSTSYATGGNLNGQNGGNPAGWRALVGCDDCFDRQPIYRLPWMPHPPARGTPFNSPRPVPPPGQ